MHIHWNKWLQDDEINVWSEEAASTTWFGEKSSNEKSRWLLKMEIGLNNSKKKKLKTKITYSHTRHTPPGNMSQTLSDSQR